MNTTSRRIADSQTWKSENPLNTLPHVEYIDDFNDHPETPYVLDYEENTATQPEEPKKENKVYTDCCFTFERPKEIRSLRTEPKKVKPYYGDLIHPPSKMIFATLSDHLSYMEAWNSRRAIL